MRKIELGQVVNIGGHYLKTLVEGLDPYQEYEDFVKATGKTSVLSFVESIQDFGKVTDKVQMSDLNDDEETFLHWERPCTRTQMNALLEVASDQVKALDNWVLEILATSYSSLVTSPVNAGSTATGSLPSLKELASSLDTLLSTHSA